MPRAQHDGSLAMPTARSGDVDLGALRREFPTLPYIEPAKALARATALIDSSPDGMWTPELQLQARACFEVEAAGIQTCVCMPEVFAREQLMSTPLFQVKRGAEVVGCKLACPGCRSNDFVLVGDINVSSLEKVRFAYGNGKAVMPISRCYSCFNPDCPDVLAKRGRTEAELATLRDLVSKGITGANATTHKKVGDRSLAPRISPRLSRLSHEQPNS